MTDPVVFHGGPIRLMQEEDFAADMPEALLVEDGRIRAIGSLDDVRRAATGAPRQADLDGRTLLPGFVDAHAHTLLHGSGLDSVDLTDVKTVDDIVHRLSRRAAERPGSPVHGYGYDQSLLQDRRHPSAGDLDRVTTTQRVQIQHASGHGYALNTIALRDFGITAQTPTPTGGRIDRDDRGEPTGVVFDAACDLLTGPQGVKTSNHGPNFHLPFNDDDVSRMFELGQTSLLAAGITTICDAQVTELEMAAYLNARDSGRLRMRAHLMLLSNKLEHLKALGLTSRLGDDFLELYGVKVYADGSVIARTAYLGAHGCCGDPTPSGYLYHEPAELQQLIMTAHAMGLRTGTHAQGDVPIGLVLDAIERARVTHPRPGLVHRIEHCGFPTESQVAAMARLGVVPVPQPMQVHLYGDSLIDEFGDWGGSFYPYGTFEEAGVPVVISSDAPVTSPGPLRAAWAAISRQTAAGDVAGSPRHQASRPAALRGITATPATLLGRSDVGRLVVGGQADLVLADTDPVTCALDDLATAVVTETWVAGSPVWSQTSGLAPARNDA